MRKGTVKVWRPSGTPTSQRKDKDMENNKEKKFNPADYTNAVPVAKAGCVYPNLYTQASHQIRHIDAAKERIVAAVEDMFGWAGHETLNFIADSIYENVYNRQHSLDDVVCDDYKDVLRDCSNEVFSRVEILKSLNSLHHSLEWLKSKREEIELTKNNVLL